MSERPEDILGTIRRHFGLSYNATEEAIMNKINNLEAALQQAFRAKDLMYYEMTKALAQADKAKEAGK